MLAVEPSSGSIFSAGFENCKKNKISCSLGFTSFDPLGYSSAEELSEMPVDLSAYLMSSSPPGFSLYNAFGVNGFDAYSNHPIAITPLKPILSKSTDDVTERDLDRTLKSSSPVCVCFTCQTQINGCELLDDHHLFLNSPLNGSDDEDSEDSALHEIVNGCRRLSVEDSAESSENETPQVPTTNSSLKRVGKRVTFADCNGLSLTEVRIMTESSDSPPNIRPPLLSSLTDGALPGVTEIPPLKLDFLQPASDYYTFREKLKHQSVSLENVILKDYTVMGTVKVKNYSFEKSVEIRVTFDGWKTHMDVAGNYVHRGDDTGALQYDTFAFEMRVPSTLCHDQSVEFCVHYHCDAGDFWDNNGGENYRICTVDYNAPAPSLYTRDFRPNFSTVEVWSEYSSWQFSAEETRYY